MERISTDLPVPDAPTMARISPAPDVDVEVLQHGRPAEGDGEAAHADDAARPALPARHQKSIPA